MTADQISIYINQGVSFVGGLLILITMITVWVMVWRVGRLRKLLEFWFFSTTTAKEWKCPNCAGTNPMSKLTCAKCKYVLF